MTGVVRSLSLKDLIDDKRLFYNNLFTISDV